MANEYGETRKGIEPTIPPAQGIYEESLTMKAPLGTRMAFRDGRVFRYAKAGAANLAPGKFVKPYVLNHSNYLNKQVAAAVPIGSYEVTVVTVAALSGCEEGWLQVNDGTGEGTQYKIKSCAANATTATSTDLVLYDPIATALVASATSEVSIIMNPWEACTVVTAITDVVLGAPPITVTAEYYFWLQTWGLANIFSEGTPAAGSKVQLAVTTQVGGTTTAASHTAPIIGYQWLLGVDGEYKPVYIMIAP